MRLAICVPFYGQVYSKTVISLVKAIMELQQKGFDINFFYSDYTYIDEAREMIIQQVLVEHEKKPFDWILHIDSDQTFTAKDVKQLLSDANKGNLDILSGIYFGRKLDQATPVLMNILSQQQKQDIARVTKKDIKEVMGKYYRLTAIPKEQFFEVDVCGFGFMACKPQVYQDILKKFDYPVFDVLYYKGEKGHEKTRDDVRFCQKAQECGYKIWADNLVRIGHMGGEITIWDFRTWLLKRFIGNPVNIEMWKKTGELMQ